MVPFRRSAFGCEICGASMPLREVGAHKRMAHAEALAKLAEAYRFFGNRLLGIFVPSSALMFVALFVPFNVFGVHAPDAYIVGVFVAWIGSIFLAWRYAQWASESRFESLGDLLYECHVCDSKIPRRAMRDHLKALHPREFGYLRIALYVVFGSLFAYMGASFTLISLDFLDLVSLPDSGMLEAIFWMGMVFWVASVAIYGTLGHPRHVERVRIAWRIERRA